MAQSTSQGSGEPIAIQRVAPTGAGARLQLTSSAFPPNGAIPSRFSAYGEGLSPGLEWNAVPGAKSWALILQDPDAPRRKPFLHWAVWDIPGEATSLPEGLPTSRQLDRPAGAIQGRNDAGETGYFGPRPPANDPPHRYHFQLFAIGRRLGFTSDIPLHTLIDGLEGDVIGHADLVGLYQHRMQ
jgi:Raf kinase inhibitor-like YbhB/YbcL family protein